MAVRTHGGQLARAPFPLEGTSDEHKAGVTTFAGLKHVYRLSTALRFDSPVLAMRMMHAHGKCHRIDGCDATTAAFCASSSRSSSGTTAPGEVVHT